MIYRITIFITILLYACNTTSKLPQNENHFTQNGIYITLEEKESEIIFKIQNTNDFPVYLFQPDQLTIQKQIGTEWEKVRILYCPCGASCPSPREFVQLKTNEFINFNWNKKESWCIHSNQQKIPETVEQNVEKGNYRLFIQYGPYKKEQTKLYYKFKLN